MDIFFQDPSVIPLPPSEVRIQHLEAVLAADQRRVHIALELTPFQQKPSLELTLQDAHGDELAQTLIIETMTPGLELTMHLRPARAAQPLPPFSLVALLFYTAPLLPDASRLPERQVVHQMQAAVLSGA